jgi:pimeloyl-ACP methyl ester carboxylesterase
MKTPTKTAQLILGVMVSITAMLALTTKASAGTPSFKVEVTGKGKQSMILIPGLTCPGDVWEETVAHYKKTYTCHVLTLPGFAGQAPIETDAYLQIVRDEIIQYIKDNKLKKPIITGHSLGGFLALWISVTEPGLISANVIVDSLPFLGAVQDPKATEASAKPMAENMRKMMASSTPEQVKQSQQYFLPGMVNDKSKLELLSKWGIESHAPTVAQAMYELQTTDLREQLSKSTTPTLVLGAWIAYKDYGFKRETIQHTFDSQYEKLANKTILLSDNGKHFLMYDDLTWMLTQMDSFLTKN